MDFPSLRKRRRFIRARLAGNTRHNPSRADLIEADKAELLGLALELRIRQTLAASPPLPPARREHLAALPVGHTRQRVPTWGVLRRA